MADLLFLCAYVAVATALLRLVRARSRGRDVPALLDALVVTIGLGVATSNSSDFPLVEPSLADPEDQHTVGRHP